MESNPSNDKQKRSAWTSAIKQCAVKADIQSRSKSWISSIGPLFSDVIDENFKRSSWNLNHLGSSPHTGNILFKDIVNKFKKFPPEVSRVLQLCFSALAVVFVNVDLESTQNKIKNPENEECAIVHSRLPSIPAGAARMLWEELLNDDETFKGTKNHDGHENGVYCKTSNFQFWKDFLTDKERNVFLKKVPSRQKDGAIFEYVRDKLIKIGLLRMVSGRKRRRSSFSISEENEDDMTTALSSVESGELDDKELQVYFQIPLDIQYQYAIFLSRAPLDKGGFSLKSYSKTIECWSQVMAIACARKMKLVFPCCSINVKKEKDEKYGSIYIDEQSKLNNDGIYGQEIELANVQYAFQVLPSLLMRARKLDDAVMLLCSGNFVLMRLMILGISNAVQQLKRDCSEVSFRTKWLKDNNLNPSILLAFQVMKEHLYSKQIIKVVPTTEERCTKEIGNALHVLARCLEQIGYEDDAIKFYKEALQYKREHDDSDSSIARTLSNLSMTYLSKRMYIDGIFVLSNLLVIQKMELCDDSLKVAETMKKMANVYATIKQYDKAISLLEDALCIERVELDESSRVLDTNYSLGRLYMITEDYERALSCYKDSLRIEKTIFGDNHQLLARSYYSLGHVYERKKSFASALKHFESALNLRKTYCASQYEDIIKILRKMGAIYADLGQWNSAISSFEEAVDIQNKNEVQQQETDAGIFYDLGNAFRQVGKYNDALKQLNRALTLVQQQETDAGIFYDLGEEVADLYFHIGSVYSDMGEFATSLEYYKEALRLKRQYRGEEDIKVAEIFHKMGHALNKDNSNSSAMECLRKACTIRQKLLGDDHVDVAETIHLMGVVHFKKHKCLKATECFQDALHIRKKAFGEIHEKIADSLFAIGSAEKDRMKYDIAIDYYLQTLEIRKSFFGGEHVKIADTLYNIATVHVIKEEIEKAMIYFRKAFDEYKKVTDGEINEMVAHVRRWITFLEGKKSIKMPFIVDSETFMC